MTLATLSTWHELMRTQNTKGLSSVLADEVIVFYSPVVHAPQIGKAITLHNLSGAFRVFLNKIFPVRPGTHWSSGGSAGVSGRD